MSLVTPARAVKSEFTFELSALHQNSSSSSNSSSNNSSNSSMEPKCKSESPATPATDMEQDNSTEGEDDEDDENAGNTVGQGIWTKEEHARFLEAIKIYANGPWKLVAAYVATRTVRQTMTHAQKYRQKAARRLRGLRTKQALMRMHYGHRITEESLVQERLRALTAQVDAASASPRPLYTPAARRAASALRDKQQQQAPNTPASPTTSTDSSHAANTGSLVALLNDPNPACTVGAATEFLGKKSPKVRKTRTTSIKVAAATGTRRAAKASKAATAIAPSNTSSATAAVSCTDTPVSPAVAGSSEMVPLCDAFDLLPTDMEIIDDLSEAPSLEECAEMLYDLLCC